MASDQGSSEVKKRQKEIVCKNMKEKKQLITQDASFLSFIIVFFSFPGWEWRLPALWWLLVVLHRPLPLPQHGAMLGSDALLAVTPRRSLTSLLFNTHFCHFPPPSFLGWLAMFL